MRKRSTVAAVITFVAAIAFAHAGHVHNFLGSVKSADSSHLVITTTDAKDVAFVLTAATTYTRDGKAASPSDLKAGTRVSVHVADDGKTATSVKLGTN